MTDRLLTDDDMAELTGYQMPAKQLESLRRIGLRPMVRPDGRPRITFAALTAAMTGHSQEDRFAGSPNFASMRKAG